MPDARTPLVAIEVTAALVWITVIIGLAVFRNRPIEARYEPASNKRLRDTNSFTQSDYSGVALGDCGSGDAE